MSNLEIIHRGFTQERLSDVSGVSVRHIAKIEKGVINPSFDILEKLITESCPPAK